MPKRKVDSDDEASFDDDNEGEYQPKPKISRSKGKARASKRKQSYDSEEDAAQTSENEPVSKKKNVPTVKKPRISSESISSDVKKSAEGEKYIELGKKKRATVRQFKGTTLIDIREFYGTEGDEKPGKKGISLSIEQWELLRDNVDTIDQLCRELKK